MAGMYTNGEYPSGNFGVSSQWNNWILDSRATCHMTPEVSDFIPVLLEDTDKKIGVADRHHVTAKQNGQVQIKCAMIMEIILSQHYTTYFWHKIYATGYF